MILPASLDLKGMCESSVMSDSVDVRETPSFSYVLFLLPPLLHCAFAPIVKSNKTTHMTLSLEGGN